MNRKTALLLAMAALLAHALGVHLEPSGRLGQPYEEAHAAFRLARNFVREGVMAWNPLEAVESGARGGLGAHASPLLVAVATLAERLYLPVNRFVQIVGVMAALLTVAASARFATDRSAGVIPALLLVTSGSFAAAAASGTEYPLLAFAVTLCFVARERGRATPFSLGLALLVASSVEGMLLAVLFGLFAALERRGPARTRAAIPVWTLLPAVALGAALMLGPDGQGGRLYLDRLKELLTTQRLADGWNYQLDFLITSITPLLLVYPLVALCLGRLSGEAQRGLLLTLAWCGLIALRGGGPRPFAIAMVPILPLLTITVQFGVIAGLDSRRRGLEPLSWAALLLIALASGLASKSTSNLSQHKAWLEDSLAEPGLSRGRLRGRPSLQEELVATNELRDLGRYLFEKVDPSLSLLTPWSGVLGYLSGRTILDLDGRRTTPGMDPLSSIRRAPDLILPKRQGSASLSMPRYGSLAVDPAWFGKEGKSSDAGGNRDAYQALADYELVTIAVPGERDPNLIGGRPLRLLRHRRLGLAPRLETSLDGTRFSVGVLPPSEGPGHPQLVNLELIAIDAEGAPWAVDPRGRLHSDLEHLARSWLMIGIEDGRSVELFSFDLETSPGGAPLVEIKTTLLNPRMRREHALAPASETIVELLD